MCTNERKTLLTNHIRRKKRCQELIADVDPSIQETILPRIVGKRIDDLYARKDHMDFHDFAKEIEEIDLVTSKFPLERYAYMIKLYRQLDQEEALKDVARARKSGR